MVNSSILGTGIDCRPDVIVFCPTGAGKTSSSICYLIQAKGRVNRALQYHQKQLGHQHKHFTVLYELASWFLDFTEPHVTADPVNEGEIQEREWKNQGGKVRLFLLVLPFIKSLLKACIRFSREIEFSLKAIKYLKAVICQILCIRPIDYLISALHPIFYIPHSTLHMPKDTDGDHSTACNRFEPLFRAITGMLCLLPAS